MAKDRGLLLEMGEWRRPRTKGQRKGVLQKEIVRESWPSELSSTQREENEREGGKREEKEDNATAA